MQSGLCMFVDIGRDTHVTIERVCGYVVHVAFRAVHTSGHRDRHTPYD